MSTPILALNEPAVVTSSYEVFEAETWVGQKLPILEHIDIGEKLEKGNWLILLYHHDCPDCIRGIGKYEQKPAGDLAGKGELPVYGSFCFPGFYSRGRLPHFRATWLLLRVPTKT